MSRARVNPQIAIAAPLCAVCRPRRDRL